MAEMNSRAWWEEYFDGTWQAHGGSDQTRHFMERLVANLPAAVVDHLRSGTPSILDWGCAFGEGVVVLAETFPNASVSGLDFASRAVDEARKRHPGRTFVHSPAGTIPASHDVIVCSNCLEHFDDPLGVVKEHLGQCRELYVALVPWDEDPLHEQHRVRFDETSFPANVGGFERLHLQRIDVDPFYWPGGEQLLVVYSAAS